MGTRYAILGSGRQGTSAAYDIARFGDAAEIRLYDIDLKTAEYAAERINSLLKIQTAAGFQLDVRDSQQLRQALKGIHSTVSDVPYHFNLEITEAAIHHLPNRKSDATTLSVTVTRGALGELISLAHTLDDALSNGSVTLDGDTDLLQRLLDALERTGTFFGVVEP